MRWKQEKGQATVEFALVLPVLLFLIFGMIDFGWVFFNKLEVNNACREGARYAAIHWEEENYETNTENHVRTFAADSDVTIQPTADGTGLKVSVTKEIQVLTGFTSTIFGEEIELESSCTMRKE